MSKVFKNKESICSRLITLFWASLAVLMLFSCKNKVPEGIISPSKLEEILFDYHMAEAAEATMPGEKGENKGQFVQAVFRKYNISEEEFSRSMAYYFRHTDKLSEVYAHLKERYGTYVANAGLSLPNIESGSDTVNIWTGNTEYMLSNQAENKVIFETKADTSFHSGDRLIWAFNSKWMYHDGAKNMMAIIKAEYANDSIVTTTRNIFASGKQEISMVIAEQPLRSITCVLYLVSPWTERPRLALIDKPVLLRARSKFFHDIDSSINNENGNRLNSDRVRDSIKLHKLREKEIRDSLFLIDNRPNRKE